MTRSFRKFQRELKMKMHAPDIQDFTQISSKDAGYVQNIPPDFPQISGQYWSRTVWNILMWDGTDL